MRKQYTILAIEKMKLGFTMMYYLLTTITILDCM